MSNSENKKDKNIFPSKILNYEHASCISETGDSIYSPEFEERNGGQIFVNESKIRDIIKEELDKRLGPSHNNKEEYDF
jgi:hypothetical protein